MAGTGPWTCSRRRGRRCTWRIRWGVKAYCYRRVKNDERDAADLADLLRMGRLPEAWIAPGEIRELREITRYRKLCRCRHRCRYAEARIMPMPGLVARPVAVAGVETSA